MADPYSDLRNAPPHVQHRMAEAVATRAVDPIQTEMRRRYLGGLKVPTGAKAVEFGCGTGHVARDLIEVAGAAEAIGIDPSSVMIDRARQLHRDVPGLRFQESDAAATGLKTSSVDLVVMHTLLCHAPAAEALVAEANRILRPGGLLAVFDGDYEITSVALSRHDPLQATIDRMIEGYVHDRWLPRRLGKLL